MIYYQLLDDNNNPIGEPLIPLDGSVPQGNFIELSVTDTTAQTLLQAAPDYVFYGEDSLVGEDIQLLYVSEIIVDGILSLDGTLIEVA